MEHINNIKSEYLSIKIGTPIGLVVPNSGMGYAKAHILDIFNDNDNILIVFKYYSPYCKLWFYRIEDLQTLDIYNNDKTYINKCKQEYYANKNRKS